MKTFYVNVFAVLASALTLGCTWTVVAQTEPPLPAAEQAREQEEIARLNGRVEAPAYDPSALAPLVAAANIDPQARESLRDIQINDIRKFSQGSGSFGLFQELSDVNRALDDDQATLDVFYQLDQANPKLAHECDFAIEPLLVRRGEYQLHLKYIGNPEARFQIYRHGFVLHRQMFENMSQRFTITTSNNVRMLQASGLPPVPQYPRLNGGKAGLEIETDTFVREVCCLIETLVGTGHLEEAEKIRAEAVLVLDDPRLQSAVTHAQAHIAHPDSTPSAGDMTVGWQSPHPNPSLDSRPLAVTSPFLPPPPPATVPAPAMINPAFGMPGSGPSQLPPINAATGLPMTVSPAIPQAEDSKLFLLIVTGHYPEAADLFRQVYCTGSATNLGMLFSGFLLYDKYPPARAALLEVRDKDVAAFSAGTGVPRQFYEFSLINDHIGEPDVTVALFKSLQDPQLAGACYYYAEPDLLHAGEYALCLKYYPNPQATCDSLKTDFVKLQKVAPIFQANQERHNRQMQAWNDQIRRRTAEQQQSLRQFHRQNFAEAQALRQQQWDQDRANAPYPDAWDWPASPPPLPQPVDLPTPRVPDFSTNVQQHVDYGLMFTNNFVSRICTLVEILVGNDRLAEAQKIRDQALAIVTDPRLQSAIPDAQARIQQTKLPSR